MAPEPIGARTVKRPSTGCMNTLKKPGYCPRFLRETERLLLAPPHLPVRGGLCIGGTVTRRVYQTAAGVTACAATAAFALAGVAQPADAQPSQPVAPGAAHRADNLPNPRAEQQA